MADVRIRLILLPLAATIVSAAPPSDKDSMMPGYGEPARKWESIEDAKASLACREKIEQVRQNGGQPKLVREPTFAKEPLLIAAVDKRVDGCAVMQMMGDINDLRPLPEVSQEPPVLLPAR